MSIRALDLAAPAVRSLSPYVPGKPISELEREYGVTDSIKLASNENPLGAGPKAVAAIQSALGDLGLYPDGNGFELKQALMRHHHCAMENITLGNGSNELLVMIAEAFLSPAVSAVYSQYAFAIYAIATHATGAIKRVAPAHPEGHRMALGHDLDAMHKLVDADTRLVFIANPNNPTGTWLEAEPLRRFIESMPPHVIVVVDEAYRQYANVPDYPDVAQWVAELPNLIVSRTFSKAYGLAGLRVGYALSSPEVADVLNRVRQAFNVNSLALVAAEAALGDEEHLARTVELNRAGMTQLQAAFARLQLRQYPSACNFLLVDCGKPAGPVYEALLRRGVIVRPVGGYGLPNHLRVTIGTPEQNERMIAGFREILQGS